MCGKREKTGEGLDAWLDEVIVRSDAGRRIAEVDYDVYAEGEAVLGWLNATLVLRGESAESNLFAERLLRGLSPGRPKPTHRYEHIVATKME
jgi:hypothetical protein